MVLLLARFNKLYTKMGDHFPRPPPQPESCLEQAFESDVSSRFKALFSGTRPVSLIAVRQGFQLLPYVHRAFSKLVAELDHPMSKWEADAAEEYSSYTLSLLHHLNCISSSVSHLGQVRVSLSHALASSSRVDSNAFERMMAGFSGGEGKEEDLGKGGDRGTACSCRGKDLEIHKALIFMKGVESWVCGALLAALNGDAEPYVKMRAWAAESLSSSTVSLDLKNLGSSVCEDIQIGGKGSVLNELRDVNDSVAFLGGESEEGGKSHEIAAELESKLEAMEKMLEGFRKEVDSLFSDVLASRNRLIDCLRSDFNK